MSVSVFHCNHRNRFVYNKRQPISSGIEKAQGPVELSCECLVSARTLYLTWSGCGLNLTGKSHLCHVHFSSLLGQSALQGWFLMFLVEYSRCNNNNSRRLTVTEYVHIIS